MACKYSIKPFDELTSVDVYYILQARAQVFLLEQQQYYQDIDEVDFDSMHLVAHKDGALVGYLRITPPSSGDSTSNKYSATNPVLIERVLMLSEHRGYGLASQMMTRAIKHCRSQYKKCTIKISTATHASPFFNRFGFEPTGTSYMKQGIEHVDMVLHSRKKVKSLGIANPSLSAMTIWDAILVVLSLLFIAGVVYLMLP